MNDTLLQQENCFYIENKRNLSQINMNKGLLRKLSGRLLNTKRAVLFYFEIASLHEIEQIDGFEKARHILDLFNRTIALGLQQLYQKNIRILAVESLWGDDFLVVVETDKTALLSSLAHLSTAYKRQINEHINKEFVSLKGGDINVQIGYAIINDSIQGTDIQLASAIKRAYGIAKGFIDTTSMLYRSEFKNILESKNLYPVYQPIVAIRSAIILGWEALIRGPQNSHFHNPENLFSFAETEGLLFPLERICRELSLRKLGTLGMDQKIFINVHPNTINDPTFTEGETIKLLQSLQIKPRNVVFEITERHPIKDFNYLNKTLTHYRDQGFLVAVDDLGCGFSNLQSIAEICPNYIKIDMSLVRGIQKDRIKKTLIETFVTFAEKIGSEIIAEGIENEAEMSTLVNIGVHYGQGYFFGKPAYPKQIVSEDVALKSVHYMNSGRQNLLKQPYPIGDLVDKACHIDEHMLVKDVKKIFDENTTLSSVVVVEKDKPRGLVMRHDLDQRLGQKFGYALYSTKTISKIMNRNPIIVPGNTPVELVSQIAMNRKKINLYDSIIVSNDNLLQGVVSVQTILDAMTKIRLELAKGANPLTGLPGNNAIEQAHAKSVKNNEPFSVIFIDLDNFKSFNDKYGFEKGDKVLIFTANILKKELAQHHHQQDYFLGHIGGDDFVIFSTSNEINELCKNIIKKFDAGIKDLYDYEDRMAGGIISRNRSGQEMWFDFVSISLAILNCSVETGKDLREISSRGAKLKQYAKSIAGSVYVHDRRMEFP